MPLSQAPLFYPPSNMQPANTVCSVCDPSGKTQRLREHSVQAKEGYLATQLPTLICLVQSAPFIQLISNISFLLSSQTVSILLPTNSA